MSDGRLPLGILRQAVMKLDSFVIDIKEAMEDEDLTEEQRSTLQQVCDVGLHMGSVLVSMVSEEIDEDDFLGEQPEMDEIEPYPV